MKKVKIIALVIVTILLCSVIFVGCSGNKKEYQVTITSNVNGAVTAVNGSVAKGKVAEFVIAPNKGYKLKAGSLKVSGTKLKETTLGGTTFVMPAEDITVKAEFEKEVLYAVGQDMLITSDEKSIYFGSYPQTIATKFAVDAMATTASENGYYVSAFDNAEYAKITAKSNAGKKESYYFTDGTKIENGKDYFFRVEPIKWDVVTAADGSSMILTDAIVDSKAFLNEENYKFNRMQIGNTYNIREGVPEKTFANSWEYSDIRMWLNQAFYNASFNANQKKLIANTELENSNTSYYGEVKFDANDKEVNKFATSQKNTNDNVFLLSAKDINNKELGFAEKRGTNDPFKMAVVSDFARCNGAWVNNNNKTYDMNGNGHWWLRSSGEKSGLVSRITSDGTSVTIPGLNVYKHMIGVRAAMNLNFKIVAQV